MPDAPETLASIANPYIRAVVYGGSGVGKTVFCCSSQQFNTFVFDVDDGVQSACAWPTTRKDRVMRYAVTDRKSFEKAWEWLRPRIQHFQLVVVDTASELQRMLGQAACEKTKKEVLDQQGWGIVLKVMEDITREFRHLPAHVIFTALEIEREHPETGRMTYRPAFQGAYAIEYAKHFSLIARYFVEDRQVRDEQTGAVTTQQLRWLKTTKDAVSHGKDRSQGLQPFEMPDIDRIINTSIDAIRRNTEE